MPPVPPIPQSFAAKQAQSLVSSSLRHSLSASEVLASARPLSDFTNMGAMSSVQNINAQQKQQRMLQQQQPNFYNLQQQQPQVAMQQPLPDVLSPDESEITALPRPPSSSRPQSSSNKKPVIKRKSALRLEASS
jgi:hypothetical protein